MKYKVKKHDLDLNLAPMIDVVFLLLIFFIVASTLNLNEVKNTINLPKTEVVTEKKDSRIIVTITGTGDVIFKEKKVSLDNLYVTLGKEIEKISIKNVTIYADKKVPFQHVVEVMDILKKLNIDSISFALKLNDQGSR